jgi:2,3-bisphosphoglycerate-independent phosphoglycerate mutase
MDNQELNLPALLVIMDGFGIAPAGKGNAITQADTPNLDAIFAACPHTLLEASGEPVGLPDGQMGNSEVGHLNIGAGRVVAQELTRINHACRDHSIDDNEVINAAMDDVKRNGGALHLMGLLSDGGVHSSNEHLYALLEHAMAYGMGEVFVHCFMDGRDVPPDSGIGYIDELVSFIEEHGWADHIKIGSISGRYYAMDRDKRWDRVKKAFDAIVHAQPASTLSPHEVMQASYDQDVLDEFVVPVALQSRGVKDGDAVVFFNFRPDRARQLSHAFLDRDFDGFDRGSVPKTSFVCMTEYDAALDAPIAFPKTFPKNVLADVISARGLRQYHIAETEKYAHVTFFINGGVEAEKPGEKRTLIASPKVATYDLQPEMSEPEVADTLVRAIRNDEADVYIVNFANCDMVGHTGNLEAAIKAVEAVDAGVGLLKDAIDAKHGFMLITADHGNADKMFEDDGTAHTAHTTAPVPFVLYDATGNGMQVRDEHGALCDIAPTLLTAAGIEVPAEMTGHSLLA